MDTFKGQYAIKLEVSPTRREAIAFVLASMLDVHAVNTGPKFVTSSDSKVFGFGVHTISQSSHSKAFSTLESGFKSLRIQLPNSTETSGWRVNP